MYSGKLTTPLTFIVVKNVGVKLGSVKINFPKYILVAKHMLLVVQNMLLVAQQHMLLILQDMLLAVQHMKLGLRFKYPPTPKYPS